MTSFQRFRLWKNKLKLKFAMSMLKIVQNLTSKYINMKDLQTRSLDYLKHPTVEGFKIKNESNISESIK